MESQALPISTARQFGRLDAGFLLMAEEMRPLWEELIRLYSLEELIALAKALPFDSRAANAVIASIDTVYDGGLHKWLDSKWADTEARRRKPGEVAVYCAAASQYAASKVLTEMLELSKRKKALMEGLGNMLDCAKLKGADELSKAMKAGSPINLIEEAKHVS